MVMGIALLALSEVTGSTSLRGFIFGVMLELSIGEMLLGVYIVAKSLAKK